MTHHPDMAEATRLQALYARRRRAYAKRINGGGKLTSRGPGKAKVWR